MSGEVLLSRVCEGDPAAIPDAGSKSTGEATEFEQSSVFVYEDISQDEQDSAHPVDLVVSKRKELNFEGALSSDVTATTSPHKRSETATASTQDGISSTSALQTISSSKRRHSEEDVLMDHSGLCGSEPEAKRSNIHARLGPIRCVKLERVDKDSPATEVAKEVCECLRERKYQLVCDCIHYLGTAKVLELYHETAEIQENGGQITADGKTRRTPGGVFFSLIKKYTSAEVRQKIFETDKKLTAKSKKIQKKFEKEQMLRARQKDVKKARQKWIANAPPLLARVERNTHKRLPILPTDCSVEHNTRLYTTDECDSTGNSSLKHTLDSNTGLNSGRPKEDEMAPEAMRPTEVERMEAEPAVCKLLPLACGGKGDRNGVVSRDTLATETEAAEEFERTDDLDLGFELV